MSTQRPGRPSKTDLRLRALRKVAAAAQDQERARHPEIIPEWRKDPQMGFLIERMEAGADIKTAYLDLLASDIPKSPVDVQVIAERLKQTPAQKRIEEAANLLFLVAFKKREGHERGLTMAEVEKRLADWYGWTVGTLHENLKRARKVLREARELEAQLRLIRDALKLRERPRDLKK